MSMRSSSGVVDVGTARGPGMEVERREVRRPHHLRHLRHAERVGVPSRGERDAHRLDPLGSLLGDALLVDRLRRGTVRVALEIRRPVAERPDDAVAHRAVVLHEVELRLLALAEVDLVRVGDAHHAPLDLELHGGRCHARDPRRSSELRHGIRDREHQPRPAAGHDRARRRHRARRRAAADLLRRLAPTRRHQHPARVGGRARSSAHPRPGRPRSSSTARVRPATRRSRSGSGCSELGYRNVRHYPGGKDEWKDAGLPLEGGRARTPSSPGQRQPG